jgi:WD40 repeat protein
VRLKSDSWTAAAVSADDARAAVSGPTGLAVTVWNLATRADLLRIDLPFIPQGIVWLPDGRLMVSAGRHPVQIWDVPARKPVATFSPPGGSVARLAVSPDGLVAAALMYDRVATAVVWDVT